jgi:cellulose synthase/poly-beta-1,6-N-acetylglucosamine synthase-like glycosyltransferase
MAGEDHRSETRFRPLRPASRPTLIADDGVMATEDIDLTWRLLLAGWHTSYEPRALVGMQVPSSTAAL